MPSHRLHRKWAEECGFDGEFANEIDRIIDDMEHHDAVKVMVTHVISTEAVVRLIHGLTPDEVKKSLIKFSKMFPRNVRKEAQYLFSELDSKGMKIIKKIYDEYGIEGLKAAILHVTLDYIEQLYLKGYNKEEIKRAITSGRKGEKLEYLLEESGLKDCIDKHFEEILYDIEASKLPSRTMKQDLEEYKNLLSKLSEIGVKAIILEGKPYSPVTGLRKAKSLLKKRGKITIGLAYEKFILKEKTIGTLPLGTFYNENLSEKLDSLRSNTP